jgi:hypothetical protein
LLHLGRDVEQWQILDYFQSFTRCLGVSGAYFIRLVNSAQLAGPREIAPPKRLPDLIQFLRVFQGQIRRPPHLGFDPINVDFGV